MVRCECDDHLTRIHHLCHHKREELLQISVKTIEHILILDRLHTVAAADVAGCVKDDVEHIHVLVLAHLVFHYVLLCKGKHSGVSCWGVAHLLVDIHQTARSQRLLVGQYLKVLAGVALINIDADNLRVKVVVKLQQRSPALEHKSLVGVVAVVLAYPAWKLLCIV